MCKVLFMDFETTDLDVTTCGVVEMGFALCEYGEGGELLSRKCFYTRINPNAEVTPEASSVHNITRDMVIGEPTVYDTYVVAYIQELVRDAEYVAGHNVTEFDLLIAKRIWKDMFIKFNGGNTLDSLKMVRRWKPELPSHKLSALRYRYNLTDKFETGTPGIKPLMSILEDTTRVVQHNAMFDVFIVEALFREMMIDTKIYDFKNLYEWSNEIIPSEVFTFGKHKGELISKVFRNDPEVIIWYIRQDWFKRRYPRDYAGIVQCRNEGRKREHSQVVNNG